MLLSDVWLDRPDIMDRLSTVLAGALASVWGSHYSCCSADIVAIPSHLARCPSACLQPALHAASICGPWPPTPAAHHTQPPSPACRLPLPPGFSQLEQPPSLFVLMGNFQSYDANAGAAHHARLREHFAALGRLINQHPAVRVRDGWVG